MKAFASTAAIAAVLAAAISAAPAATLAAAPATPSNPVELLSLSGKSTAGFRFVPLDGAARGLTERERPTVLVLFASWCSPCMQEMPRTLAEYARYRRSVDFLGIDYTDPPAVTRGLIAKFHIGFPVESYVPQQVAPHESGRQVVHVPDTMTQSQLHSLQNQLPPETYQRIADAYSARSTMTPEHFQAYEKWIGVYFETPQQSATRRAAEAAPKAAQPIVGLPHTFVIDAHGILRYVLEGYTPSLDRVAQSLKKLGY